MLECRSIFVRTTSRNQRVYRACGYGGNDGRCRHRIDIMNKVREIWLLFKKDIWKKSTPFFEMTNLRKQESGLPYDLWLDSAGCTRNTHHKVMRIKVGVGDELITVVIYSKRDIRPLRPFRMENKIVSWVCDNYDTLFKHWNGELSDRQALNLLSKD